MASKYFDPSQVTDGEKAELIKKIGEKCIIEDKLGCHLWKLSINSSGYPQMKLGKTYSTRFSSKPYNPGHILLSISKNLKLNINGHEVSHLCHNKKCTNITHLSYEPKSVNSSRELCKFGKSYCITHEVNDLGGHRKFPNCLIW